MSWLFPEPLVHLVSMCFCFFEIQQVLLYLFIVRFAFPMYVASLSPHNFCFFKILGGETPTPASTAAVNVCKGQEQHITI